MCTVRNSSAVDVCYGTPDRGRQALQDHVGGDRQVDQLGGDSKVARDHGNGREVDVGREGREGGGNRHNGYDDSLLARREDAVRNDKLSRAVADRQLDLDSILGVCHVPRRSSEDLR